MLTALLICLDAPKPEEVWAKVVDSYGKAPAVAIKFTTTWAGKKKPLYVGTLNFTREKSLKYEFKDSFEGCNAGCSWTKANGGSTWVSPPRFRGYNDTLTPRHPYLLVDLIEGTSHEMEWNSAPKSVTLAKTLYWVLTNKAGTTFTINSKTWRITKFVGPELYDEERICTTVIR